MPQRIFVLISHFGREGAQCEEATLSWVWFLVSDHLRTHTHTEKTHLSLPQKQTKMCKVVNICVTARTFDQDDKQFLVSLSLSGFLLWTSSLAEPGSVVLGLVYALRLSRLKELCFSSSLPACLPPDSVSASGSLVQSLHPLHSIHSSPET